MKRLGKKILRRLFEIGQKIGVDILPRSYYSEIPDLFELRHSEAWKRPYSMTGVQGSSVTTQLDFVKACCPEHLIQRQARGDIHSRACKENGASGFGPIEADFLFCFISTIQPKKIVQIGCGVSTAIILTACREANYSANILCIDPYPTDFLVQKAKSGEIRLIKEKAQNVDRELLLDLGQPGLLFIDSTHTIKPGSEVTRILLEILPLLQKDSWVHFHDIYFPYTHSPTVLKNELFFNYESVLLQAFLTLNKSFTIKASLSMLHHGQPDSLRVYLPNYKPALLQQGLLVREGHFPSSIYLQTVQDSH